MPKQYHPASDEMLERFAEAIDRHFTNLDDEAIRFDIQAVTTSGLHALPKGATAQIKIVGPEERSKGGPDVRILVDFAKYQSHKKAIEREAMFAHELYHVDIQRDKRGVTKRDPYDRPVIRLKPDDWYITGFKEVADWYGANSLERISHSRMEHALYHQTLMQFYAGHDGDREPTLPLDRVEPDTAHRQRKAEIDADLGKPDIVRETFAALLSVGHTEGQARVMIDSVLAGNGVFKTVSEMIDAIYHQQTEKVDVDAELSAGVREVEESRQAFDETVEADAWRSVPIGDLHLAERTMEKLADHDIATVGELVTLLYRGDLDSILIGQAGMDSQDCLLRFHGSLPTAQAADFAHATTPGNQQAERRTRGRREKVTA